MRGAGTFTRDIVSNCQHRCKQLQQAPPVATQVAFLACSRMRAPWPRCSSTCRQRHSGRGNCTQQLLHNANLPSPRPRTQPLLPSILGDPAPTLQATSRHFAVLLAPPSPGQPCGPTRCTTYGATAAAAKATVFAMTAVLSSVRLTMGPRPKEKNRLPHSGKNSTSHTQRRCTKPALGQGTRWGKGVAVCLQCRTGVCLMPTASRAAQATACATAHCWDEGQREGMCLSCWRLPAGSTAPATPSAAARSLRVVRMR